MIKQVFHHYTQWEDWKAGMFQTKVSNEAVLIKKSRKLLATPKRLEKAMLRAVQEWPLATAVNLTNISCNRRAWLGQAACCIEYKCPEIHVRTAWNSLSEVQQKEANAVATEIINKYISNLKIMPKTPLGINVFEAARERIAWTFDRFPKVYISYSGGKDSTVMLHMVMDEAIKRGRKVGVLFIDLEGQYKLTINHIQECYDMYKDYIEPFWCCLPIHLRNAVSVFETHWICWDKDKEKSWIRIPPKMAITDETYFPFFRKGMEFEEFVPEFGAWYGKGEMTACFVGIRTDESLNRFRTVATLKKERLEDKQYTTRVIENVYNIYPIYDWKVDDLWVYHAKNPKKPHNWLYDCMYKAGLTLSQMRICQPYGDDQRKGLWLFHLIEPETWAKIVARVNGANSGALYVKESGNFTGYRKINKPDGHTWKSFAGLLLSSMPPKTQVHFENKVAVFQKWWQARGYPEGIPDEGDYRLEAERKIPSWRRVCKSLLRNDYWCKGMGFSQHRSGVYDKYLKLMKKRRKEWDMEKFNYTS